MFFVLSKLFWFVFNPLNLIFFVLLTGLIALGLGWLRLGRAFVGLAVAAFILIGFTTFIDVPLRAWENRYGEPEITNAPTGIIVLGGGLGLNDAEAPEQYHMGASAKRLVIGFRLKRTYPSARLIFSGGNASLTGRGAAEALAARAFTRDLYGYLADDPDFIEYEADARTTAENAQGVRAMIEGDGSDWIVITSAFHMPRAVAAFRAEGLYPVPYPADRSARDRLSPFVTASAVVQFRKAEILVKEWIGMFAYRLTGRAL